MGMHRAKPMLIPQSAYMDHHHHRDSHSSVPLFAYYL